MPPRNQRRQELQRKEPQKVLRLEVLSERMGVGLYRVILTATTLLGKFSRSGIELQFYMDNLPEGDRQITDAEGKASMLVMAGPGSHVFKVKVCEHDVEVSRTIPLPEVEYLLTLNVSHSKLDNLYRVVMEAMVTDGTKPVPNVPLNFYSDREDAGSAQTDGNGRAIVVSTATPGPHFFTTRIAESTNESNVSLELPKVVPAKRVAKKLNVVCPGSRGSYTLRVTVLDDNDQGIPELTVRNRDMVTGKTLCEEGRTDEQGVWIGEVTLKGYHRVLFSVDGTNLKENFRLS